MDIQNTFSDIRNCFLDIKNNYFGYPINGINVNPACHTYMNVVSPVTVSAAAAAEVVI